MVVCKFFLNGNCRFGSSCHNEHPTGLNSQTQFNNNNNNRAGFTNQQTPFGMNNLRNGPFRGRQDNKRRTYELDAERIRADFTKERPIWPFSAYGPTSDQPRQMIEGEVEISPEEMRCRAYLVRTQGRPQSEVNEMETTANSKMSKVVQDIMSDTMAAIRYVQRGEDEHPNRWDVMQAAVEGTLDKLQTPSTTQQNTLGQNPNSAPANPSPFGAPASGFGKPSFGQPSGPTASPFGASSNQTPSPFGQPSATNPSPFAQANANTNTNANASPFGQLNKPTNSPFGQPSGNTSSPFGQGAAPTTSAFGQPSAINDNSPFGKPSVPGATGFGQPSGFGKPSSLTANSPFASASPFGSVSTTNPPAGPVGMLNSSNNASASPFAQAGTNTTNNSPFAQKTDNTSPFAVKQPQNTTAFGTPSLPGGRNIFNQTNPQSSPFGQNNASNPAAVSTTSPFATAARPSIAAVSSPFASASRPSGPLNIASNTKIFPTGVPTAPLCEDPPTYQYGGNEAAFKDAYTQAFDTVKQGGAFPGDVMPLVAPKWEWVSFQL